MKTERYKDLEEKFFEAKTSPEEEKYLKEQGNDGLFGALKDAGKEKMNWDFDDFMKKIPENTVKIPLHSHKKPGYPKFFWMAASLILAAGLYFGLQHLSHSKIADTDNRMAMEIQKQKNDFNNENSVAVNSIADSVSVAKDSLTADTLSSKNTPAEEDIMDKILSRKGRMRKQVKARYAESHSSVRKSDDTPKTEYQNNYVIINGHRINSEKEAIDVARYSFQMLSDKVTKTLASTVVQESPQDE